MFLKVSLYWVQINGMCGEFENHVVHMGRLEIMGVTTYLYDQMSDVRSIYAV